MLLRVKILDKLLVTTSGICLARIAVAACSRDYHPDTSIFPRRCCRSGDHPYQHGSLYWNASGKLLHPGC